MTFCAKILTINVWNILSQMISFSIVIKQKKLQVLLSMDIITKDIIFNCVNKQKKLQVLLVHGYSWLYFIGQNHFWASLICSNTKLIQQDKKLASLTTNPWHDINPEKKFSYLFINSLNRPALFTLSDKVWQTGKIYPFPYSKLWLVSY